MSTAAHPNTPGGRPPFCHRNTQGNPVSLSASCGLDRHRPTVRLDHADPSPLRRCGRPRHRFTSACTKDARKAVIDKLYEAGIATVVVAGNNALSTAVTAPACVPNAVSVAADGDVVLEATLGVEQTETAPSTDEELADPSGTRYYDRSAWYSVSDTIFGVKVTTVKIGVEYRTTSSRVTKVYGGWASHRLFVPFAEFSNSPVQTWISADPANNATAQTIWQGKWAGSSWDARERIWADQSGFKGGYLK